MPTKYNTVNAVQKSSSRSPTYLLLLVLAAQFVFFLEGSAFEAGGGCGHGHEPDERFAWRTPATGTFNDTLNWSPFGSPGPSDTGLIGLPGEFAVALDCGVACESLLVDGTGVRVEMNGFGVSSAYVRNRGTICQSRSTNALRLRELRRGRRTSSLSS